MSGLFDDLRDLYQEVWGSYSFIKQARKIKLLEDLKDRTHKGRRVSYAEMLTLATALLADLKFELATYFGTLIDQAIHFSETMLNDRYLIRTYVREKDDNLTENGLRIKKLYRRLVSLVDELKAIRKTRAEA